MNKALGSLHLIRTIWLGKAILPLYAVIQEAISLTGGTCCNRGNYLPIHQEVIWRLRMMMRFNFTYNYTTMQDTLFHYVICKWDRLLACLIKAYATNLLEATTSVVSVNAGNRSLFIFLDEFTIQTKPSRCLLSSGETNGRKEGRKV